MQHCIMKHHARDMDVVSSCALLGIQPAVAAMVARGVHRIGDDAVRSGSPREVDYWLCALVLISTIASLMRVNFLITNALW